MRTLYPVLATLSTLANVQGQLAGLGGRPFVQLVLHTIYANPLDNSACVATALLVNLVAFSVGVPGYTSLGLADPHLTLAVATVAAPAAVFAASAAPYGDDHYTRLAYAVLAAAAGVGLWRRATNLSRGRDVPLLPTHHKEACSTAPENTVATSANKSKAAVNDTVVTVESPEVPKELFAPEGNFVPHFDVERLSLLDDSDHSDAEAEPDHSDVESQSFSGNSFCNSVPDALSRVLAEGGRVLSASISSFSFLSSTAQSGLHTLSSSAQSSLFTLSSTAQSFLTMSASKSLSGPSTSYGALESRSKMPWRLLDTALQRYMRPRLTMMDKTLLAIGGALCGATGIGAAEGVLLVLVGLHDVPLAVAATVATSVAFYVSMSASIIQAISISADPSSPAIADSVPWPLVGCLLPGVFVGALVGPRMHAFFNETIMLRTAAAALFGISAAVTALSLFGGVLR